MKNNIHPRAAGSAAQSVIAFPNVAISMGGAASVRYNLRFAWVTIPGEWPMQEIRVPRTALPDREKWTAFNLADGVAAYLGRLVPAQPEDSGESLTGVEEGWASSLQVLPAVGWAWDNLNEDRQTGAAVWREVTEEFYYEMLGVLPPIYGRGPGFMVSEEVCQSARGPVFLGLVMLDGKHYGREVARVDFDISVQALRNHLSHQRTMGGCPL